MVQKTDMIMPILLKIRKQKMFMIRVYTLVLLIFSIGIHQSAHAKNSSESVDLKTIKANVPTSFGELKTEIHFDEKDFLVAKKVEKIIKTDLIKAVNYFQYVPENIVHFNVDPYMRLTNGNARIFPTGIINLYNFPPDNSDHLVVMEDWLRGLVFHEYVHITHLDQTDDWMELGKKIFGSIAKLPASVVPRWFVEGIAVWGESHLLGSGGRLNNPLFRKELLIQFLRAEYCTTIDCLDEPGVYPNGQLAYWAGAHFMEYLENKKPATVKCLVEKNSGAIPFLLNDVFFNCTGKNAKDQFEDFRQSFINDQPSITPASEEWGVKISNAFGSDALQKGVVLDGNILYKVERERKSEALLSYDLEENVNMMSAHFSYPIGDLAGMTTMPTEGDAEAGKYLIIAFNEDPNYRQENRTWKLINAETLLEEVTLPFAKDPSYVIGLGNHRFLTASFVNNAWVIERQRYDFDNQKMFEPEVVLTLPSDSNLTMFKKEGQKIFMKVNGKNDLTTFMVSDLSLESFHKVYESSQYFDFTVLTEKFAVIHEKKEVASQYTLYEFDDALKKVSSGTITPDLFNRVTYAAISDNRVLVLENRLKSKEMAKEESLNILKKATAKLTSADLVSVNLKDGGTPVNKEGEEIESYPKWYHYKPHYWFVAFGSSENISSIGATTTFSDPMDLNILDVSVLTFPSIKKVGGNGKFIHKFSEVSDLWSAYLYFSRDFSKSDVSSVTNETKEGIVGTSYAFLMKRWSLIPGLYVTSTKTADFISTRSANGFGFSNALLYQAQSFDDTFQNLMAQMRLELDNPNVGENYAHAKFKLQTEWRFYERLVLGVKTSWAKLFKTNFSQGVLYGGGVTTASTQRWHEFYGIPYSNAYGNELLTFRLYLDYNIWNIYRTRQLFPVFFKELHLLLGRETIYADRILLGKSFIREKAVHGFFVGPRLKVNLFYYVPADIDFIFSQVKNPQGGNVNGFLFNISAEAF